MISNIFRGNSIFRKSTKHRELEMDKTLNDNQPAAVQGQPQTDSADDEASKIHALYRSRLMVASLRTEAVKAGMVDLDGLKLIDTSALALDADDKVVGGRKLMEDLRREKPWLFGTTSS